MSRLWPIVLSCFAACQLGCSQEEPVATSDVPVGGVTIAETPAEIELRQNVEEPPLTVPPPEQAAAVLYEPQADDFRPLYDADPANAERQSWDDYWHWVQMFYSGDMLTLGWRPRSKSLIEAFSDSNQQRELIERLNELGKALAAEWSKDNAVRKINNLDLFSWGYRLSPPKMATKEDHERLIAALDEITQSASARLKTGVADKPEKAASN